MTDKKHGDEEFQKFLKRTEGGKMKKDDAKGSIRDEDYLIIYTLKEKIKTISETLSNTISTYKTLTEDSQVKRKLERQIDELIKNSNDSIQQFDFMVMDVDGEVDEEDEKDFEDDDTIGRD